MTWAAGGEGGHRLISNEERRVRECVECTVVGPIARLERCGTTLYFLLRGCDEDSIPDVHCWRHTSSAP